MLNNFIYLLILLIKEYENAFKIGCTDNYSNRLPSYGGDLGPYEYEADVIEILDVPYEIKVKFINKVDNHRLCNYAEAYLHSLYKDSRVINPTSHWETEFFNPFEKRPQKKDIIEKLEKGGIKFKVVGKYNKINHLESLQSKKKSSSSSEKDKKIPFEENDEEKEKMITRYFKEPLSFIKRMILNGDSHLRLIQSELWDELNEKPDEINGINGIIQWPTGTGKRIAIIMIVIVLYLHYKNKGKIFRCVIAANRNDIFQGDAWIEYQLIQHIGLKVYEGKEGKLSKLKDIKDNESFLLVTTHQSLVKKNKGNDEIDEIDELTPYFKENISKFKINCMIYDETQNITSSKMYEYLMNNKPDHLIGISATPSTDDKDQNHKLHKLFNKKFISKCSYETAIKENWINDCNYHIYGYDKNDQPIDKITKIIDRQIRLRIDKDIWKRKKFIIWIPETNEKKEEYIKYIKENTNWTVFTDINDKEFKRCNTTDIPWCLVLCQKGREGYDQKDIEFGVSIGNSSCHLYIQEQGRSQRRDYDGKISELLIFTEKDKMNDVNEDINQYMEGDYIGEIKNIEDVDIEEEIESENVKQKELELRQIHENERQIQNEIDELKKAEKQDRINKRQEENKKSKIVFRDKFKQSEFSEKSKDDQYELAKKKNKELKINDDKDYRVKKTDNLYYNENPKEYFSDQWINWYDFLGIETSCLLNENDFREQTKDIWKETEGDYYKFADECKSLGLPHFDYKGLYGKEIDEIHIVEREGRRK